MTLPNDAARLVEPALGHLKHIENVEHWARADAGQRGQELREAAAFIVKQNAEIDGLVCEINRLRNALARIARGRPSVAARLADDVLATDPYNAPAPSHASERGAA